MDGVSGIFDSGNMPLLRKALSAYALRHRVVAENIANVDTEGYQAQRVAFESLLQEQGRIQPTGARTHPGHLPIGVNDARPAPAIEPTNDLYDNGTNNVDIEEQSMLQMQNVVMYNMATRMLRAKYMGLRSAITGQVQ